jgi:hypothetical protein
VKTEKAVKKSSHLKSQAGYILLSLMTLTALIPGLVLIGLNYTDIIEQGSRISKTTLTKTQMHTIRNIVANSARDVDADGAFDVWRERAGNTVPAAVTVNSRDQWGTDFRYCAYDLRTCNQVDAAFSQNNPNAPCIGFSPPTTDLVLRIISAGRDRVFQTDCRSASAIGDDIVLDEVEAGIRVGGTGGAGGGGGGAGGGGVIGGGWTDDGSVVRLTDPNDRVGIGTTTPLGSLDVLGRTFLTLENTANNWVYLRGNVHGTLPSASALQGLIYGWNSSGGLGESQILYVTALGAAPRLDFGRWSGAVRTIDMTLIDGSIGIGTASPVRRLDVHGGVIAFSYEHHSSRDLKSNIQTMKAEEALSILNQLRPVEFKYKDDPEERRLGFIAEEVPKILSSEDRQGVKIMDTVAALTKVIQEQQKEIEELKSNIEQLESNTATTQNSDKLDIDTAFKIIAMSLLIALSIKISEARYKAWLKR